MLVVGLIVGGMCALLALNTASAANELSRHNLAVKDADVAAQVQQLQNEVAASAAPGSLGSAAAALGMVPAGNPAFLQVGSNGVVRVLGSPAPASAPPQPVAVKVTLATKAAPGAAKSATSTGHGHPVASTKPTSTRSAPKPTGPIGNAARMELPPMS